MTQLIEGLAFARTTEMIRHHAREFETLVLKVSRKGAQLPPRSTPYASLFVAAPTPSIKEMKAAITAAGMSVADLFEKDGLVERYRQALARTSAPPAESAPAPVHAPGAGVLLLLAPPSLPVLPTPQLEELPPVAALAPPPGALPSPALAALATSLGSPGSVHAQLLSHSPLRTLAV